MAKLRFLRSVIIPSLDKVLNFNDELDISDEKLINELVEKGYVDVLIEEKIPEKPTKRAPKRPKEETDLDV